MTFHYITWHSITLHCIALHCIAVHRIATSRHVTSPHHITSHHITSHRITLHHITLHHITVQYITLHYITLHYTILQHYIELPYIHTYICVYNTCPVSDLWFKYLKPSSGPETGDRQRLRSNLDHVPIQYVYTWQQASRQNHEEVHAPCAEILARAKSWTQFQNVLGIC